MRVEFITTLIVLSLLGLIDSGYLALNRRKKEKLACPIGHECNEVLESKWGEIFYVRNEKLGIIYYLAVLTFGVYLIFNGKTNAINILFYISLIGILFSAFLVFVQAKIIRNYCFYCLISAIISLLIFVNVLLLKML